MCSTSLALRPQACRSGRASSAAPFTVTAGGVREIDVEEIGALAGRYGGIVWLGLHEPDAALLEIVRAQLGLHELVIEDVNQAHQRPKLDIYDNALFIVL